MKLPPALSWMHLLPRDASFECDASAPEWLRALLIAKPRSGGATVAVAGTDLGKDAFVGVNSEISNRALKAAGFSHIRRFAVLPDTRSARWFVPLDSPSVSSAAFSLYSPARFSARLKVAAARIATYSRLPVWYRDSIVIAQRSAPPIESKLAEVFAGTNFTLALSSGAPEPARNRKVSFAVIKDNGRIIGFGKLAGSTLSTQLMRDEAKALPELARRRIGAPELLFAGEVDGAFATLQKPLKGKPVSTRLAPNKLDLLASLRSGRTQRATDCRMVLQLASRVAKYPQLADALESITPILSHTRAPSTIVHGDFAPWNLRQYAGDVVAFDWEYAELDGLPLVDETHYRLQVGYLLESWDLARAGVELTRMQQQNDLLLPAEQVRAIQVVYLLDNLARLFAEGYDEAENEMVGWYGQLLRQLCPARKELVAA